MGVPKLFQSLIQKYHHHTISNPTGYNIIVKSIDTSLPTHLYLDFNCGIYQCIKPEIKTEDTLILYVVEYLELLCNITPNLELIFIALDGVPVGGKIKNQRERRFHSVCKKNRANNLNNTYGMPTDPLSRDNVNNNIDTNMITPGTTFMYKLNNAIKQRIKQYQTGKHNITEHNITEHNITEHNITEHNITEHNITEHIFSNKKIIFNDSSIPGEGEHKLIHHIKESKHKAVDGNAEEVALYGKPHNTVIYALDGDLIFLSLSLHIDNLYLFREANEYGSIAMIHAGRKYLYMDIDGLACAIIKNFKDNYGCTNIAIDSRDNKNTIIKNKYIDDYIFLGMLLGNDFMPKTHWFSIGEGGYEKILSAYWQIHNHTEIFLVDVYSLVINTEMLCDIMFIVKEQEQASIIKLFEKRKKQRIHTNGDTSERERQQLLIDFYPLQHLYVEREIEPSQVGWRERYYNICLHMAPSSDNIKMVCQSYLKTLVWNFHYYFGDCISWDWVYNFDYSPTWNDIYNELLLHKNINASSSNKIFHFTKGHPVDQQTLLFMVLPWNSRQFMARDVNNKLNNELSPMRIYFPKRYSLNVAFLRYYHECTPIIYKMEYSKVHKFIKDCKLTDDEKLRNTVGELFTT